MTVLWVVAGLVLGALLGLVLLGVATVAPGDRLRCVAVVTVAWPALIVFALWVSGKASPAGGRR